MSKNLFKLKSLVSYFLPFLLLMSVIFSSCYSSQIALKENVSSACNDSLYLALQKKDSTAFTKSEADYYHKFRDECNKEFDKAALDDGKSTVLWVLGIVGGIVVILAGFGALMGRGC